MISQHSDYMPDPDQYISRLHYRILVFKKEDSGRQDDGMGQTDTRRVNGDCKQRILSTIFRFAKKE